MDKAHSQNIPSEVEHLDFEDGDKVVVPPRAVAKESLTRSARESFQVTAWRKVLLVTLCIGIVVLPTGYALWSIAIHFRTKMLEAEAEVRAAKAEAESTLRTAEEEKVRAQADFRAAKEAADVAVRKAIGEKQLAESEARSAKVAAKADSKRSAEQRIEPREKQSEMDPPAKQPVAKTSVPRIRAAVLKVSEDRKFVEVSAGTDDGLQVGHELVVYRLVPSGRYVCQIRIVSVDSKQAVGELILKTKNTTPQIGDEVADRISRD